MTAEIERDDAVTRSPGRFEVVLAFSVIDERIFHELYHKTAGPLRAYAARTLGNVAQADDIVQEAYLRLLRSSVQSDDPQYLRAYLFRVASNLMVDYFRRQNREIAVADIPERATATVDPTTRIDMGRIFRRLSVRQRQLLWLAHVEGADHREIASILDVGERSVRVLLLRARRKLAKLIKEGPNASVE